MDWLNSLHRLAYSVRIAWRNLDAGLAPGLRYTMVKDIMRANWWDLTTKLCSLSPTLPLQIKHCLYTLLIQWDDTTTTLSCHQMEKDVVYSVRSKILPLSRSTMVTSMSSYVEVSSAIVVMFEWHSVWFLLQQARSFALVQLKRLMNNVIFFYNSNYFLTITRPFRSQVSQ